MQKITRVRGKHNPSQADCPMYPFFFNIAIGPIMQNGRLNTAKKQKIGNTIYLYKKL